MEGERGRDSRGGGVEASGEKEVHTVLLGTSPYDSIIRTGE